LVSTPEKTFNCELIMLAVAENIAATISPDRQERM
jgi:hypothetical protein